MAFPADEENIFATFLSEPERLYELELNGGAQSVLFSLEEAMVSLRTEPVSATLDEQELACRLESLAAGDDNVLAGLAGTDREALIQTHMAVAAMDSTTRTPTPEALLAVVERSLKPEHVAKGPSFIVNLARAQMQVIKSTFQGLTAVSLPAIATRHGGPGIETPNAREMLRQVIVQGNRRIALEFELVRASDQEVTLLVRNLPDDHTTRVDLLRDDRRMESRVLNGAGETLIFERLGAGRYELRFQGGFNHQLEFVLNRSDLQN